MKYIILPVMLLAVVALAAPAFAETGTSNTEDRKMEREHSVLEKLFRKSGPSIHITQGGRVQLDAGLVTAVSGSELTVKLFGHSYVVNTENAKDNDVTPTVDSRVWVKGKMNESTGEIDAMSVRTFTGKEVKERVAEVRVKNASTTPLKLKDMDFQEELKRLLEKLKNLKGNQ